MYLTDEEQAVLRGDQGETLQKIMRSVVLYGEAFDADRLAPIEGSQHLVISYGANTMKPYLHMLDELIAAGLRAQQPFYVNPRPVDYATMRPDLLQQLTFKQIYDKQAEYEKQLHALGLKDSNAFTCACYLPEVGNIPRQGARLAWSESSAVVYANSVLGARSNRNAAGIDLLCAILGKAPNFGLLTDAGRKATWLVEIRTRDLPNPHLLGSAIGIQVMAGVPYIIGLDGHLSDGLNLYTEAYLKDMGAAAASNGAVDLFHVEQITPEAVEFKRGLLNGGCRAYIIDDAELERVQAGYPVIWENAQAKPKRVFIGCPHLSLEQAEIWINRIRDALTQRKQAKARVPVYLFTTPQVLEHLRGMAAYKSWLAMDVHLTTICPQSYLNNPLCAREPVVTNSSKLRACTSARFYLDEDVLEIALTGLLPQGGKYA